MTASTDHPHRRANPLTGRHVLVSPHRGNRPWLGQQEPTTTDPAPTYSPDCYLCPGNARVGGEVNPAYDGVYAFDNDFQALLETSGPRLPDDELFDQTPATGRSRVICFSPDHSASLPSLNPDAMRAVIDLWCTETETLGRDYPWVQVFENKGAIMGCSNPHPHGQIWATSFLPDEAIAEDERQRAYFARHGRAMLADVAEREIAAGDRLVVANPLWAVVVPFWASWPFETLILPRLPLARMPDMTGPVRDALRDILQRLTRGYDRLFGVSFPYSMGWHGAPYDGRPTEGWQLHAHVYPPLLRSASVRKFMVGFEMLAEAQRDLTPEQAAERLRAVMP